MFLSEILINALNTNHLNRRLAARAAALCERWGVVQLHSGNWAPQHDCVLIDSSGEYALEDDAFVCPRCDCYELDDESFDVNVRVRGRLRVQRWCEPCSNEHSFYCTDCSSTFEIDEMHDGFCSGCAEWRNQSQRDGDTHPLLRPYHSERPPNPYGFGGAVYSVELEMEGEPGRVWELVENIHQTGVKRLTTERDGSLGDTGVEVQISWRESFVDLAHDLCAVATASVRAGARSWDAPSAPNVGLHISSNLHKAWTLHRKMRLVFLVSKLKKQLVQIAGRESDRYAQFLSGSSLKSSAQGYCGKFVALHFAGNRAEWRLFRGTLNHSRLRLYCDTVQSLEYWALSDIRSKDLAQVASSALSELYNNFKGGKN